MKTKQEKISYWAFLIVIIISTIALAGWIANKLSLASIAADFIPMAPATALTFIILGGISLNFLMKNRKSTFIQILLTILLIFNSIVLFDALQGYPLAVEQFFSKSASTFKNFPIGRMSPMTIVLFLISLVTLILISNPDKPLKKLSIFLGSFGLLLAFILDLGYLYGTPLLYNQSIIPPALNTSVAFTFLFGGIMVGFGMKEKPLIFFVGESVRARLMRSFFPITLFLIVVAGWVDTLIFKIYNDHVFVSATVTIASLFALSYTILRLSKKIGNDIDEVLTFRTRADEKLRESELHFRTLADSGQALIWTSGTDKKCNYFNQPWLDFTGRRLEQELGDGWAEGVHPDDLNRCLEIYVKAFDRQERFTMDYRLRYRDGSYRWIQDNGTPRFNLHHEFAGYIGHCLDITERKLIEEALIKSEERYRLISSVANDYTFSTRVMPDGSLDLEWVAGAFESISGYTVEEFKARGAWRATIHPEDLYLDDRDIARLQNNQDTESQLRTINRNGEIVWVHVYAHPVWDEKSNCLSGIYGAVQNITEQKLADIRLKESEEKYRSIFENSSVAILLTAPDGSILSANHFACKLFGYTEAEICKLGRNGLIDVSDSRLPFLLDKRQKTGHTRGELSFIRKDGTKFDCELSSVIFIDNEGKELTSMVIRDLTEQKQAESSLAINEKKYKYLFDNNPLPMWIFDQESLAFLEVNNSTIFHYGYSRSEFLSMTIKDIRPSDDIDTMLKYVQDTSTIKQTGIWRHRRKNGEIIFVEVIVHSIDFAGRPAQLVLANDVTERTRAEIEIQKLNDELEQKVKARTDELEQKNADLESMNKLFVGRELRMIELKERINELEIKLQLLSKS